MGLLSKLFGKKDVQLEPLRVDMHSHLLPALDDGAEDLEQSLTLVRKLSDMGYQKFIMTPHIMGDFYKNTPEGILGKLDVLRQAVKEEGIDVTLEAAAEYYLDEWFVERLEKGEKLLTFGDNYLLFETSYINRPHLLHDVIFQLKSLGYVPVLAHPERYTYLYESFEEFKKIYELGALFQLNLNSITGYYSGAAKKYAQKLIDHKMVDFVGTDCHAERHVKVLKKVHKDSYYAKVLELPLKNRELI